MIKTWNKHDRNTGLEIRLKTGDNLFALIAANWLASGTDDNNDGDNDDVVRLCATCVPIRE